MSQFVQVLTTTASEQEAQRISEALVENRLAACVQLSGPIQSVYRWQGQVERAEEWQCVAKTSSELLSGVVETIKRLHSYDCPEIVSLPIQGGSPEYLDWLAQQLASDEK